MLYLVATPIGNLGDITFRAAEALRSADVIACEDTRRSLALLNHLEIKKPLLSCHKFNERASGEKILALLREGKTVAVITDAGMPVVSDPGNLLVKMLIEAGEPYTVLPGACACVTALAFGGLDADRFCFLGFLPEKNAEREALWRHTATSERRSCSIPRRTTCGGTWKRCFPVWESGGRSRCASSRSCTRSAWNFVFPLDIRRSRGENSSF